MKYTINTQKDRQGKGMSKCFALVFLTALPVLTQAQQVPKPQKFSDVVHLGIDIIQGVIALGWIFLVMGFVYGVYKFLANFNDEKAREDGKRLLVWSLIGSAILLGVYGILGMLNNSVSGGSFGIPLLTPPAP